MPDGVHAQRQAPESVLGFFSGLLGWADSYTKIKKFLRTRNAVMRGEKIFDLSSEDLKREGLMGPLTFNFYESTLADLPAASFAVLIRMFLQERPKSLQLAPGVSEFRKTLVLEVAQILPKISTKIDIIMPPFFLLILAWSAAWGSLKRSDSSGPKIRRCRDAFLYYDGAFGLWVQVVLCFAILLLLMPTNYVLDNSIPLIAGGVLLVLSLIYQLYLVDHKIPKLLFRDNSYDSKVYRFWNRTKPANRAPWSKYSVAVILSSTMAWIAFGLILAIQIAVAYAVAFCVVWLRGRVTGHL